MRKRKTTGERIIERYDFWIDKYARVPLVGEIDDAIRKKYAKVWDDAVDHMGRTGGLVSVTRRENPYRARKKKGGGR